MNVKQTPQRSHDVETAADETLTAARKMAPGSEHIEALKAADMLRNEADVFGVIFAPPGRKHDLDQETASVAVPRSSR